MKGMGKSGPYIPLINEKKIKDAFEIKIGNCNGSLFVCGTKRLGAVHPEPFSKHRLGDWIISKFDLKEYKTYKIEVTVAHKKS